MRLTANVRETSFYESFSDLIFGTLVLFIVVLMALALRVQDSLARCQAEVAKVVYPSRFAGGASRTRFSVCHIPVDGQIRLVWIPPKISSTWTGARSEGGSDPILALCRAAKSRDGLAMSSPEEVVSMAGGFSYSLLKEYVNSNAIGTMVHIIEQTRRANPARFRRMSAEDLKQHLGGVWADNEQNMSSAHRLLKNQYEGWDPGSRRLQTIVPAFRRAKELDGEAPARIRFTSPGPNRIQVGDCEMSAATFRGILRSIKPGSGFYLEYLSPDGGAEEPPEWILKDVLVELGFDGRVLSARGLELSKQN